MTIFAMLGGLGLGKTRETRRQQTPLVYSVLQHYVAPILLMRNDTKIKITKTLLGGKNEAQSANINASYFHNQLLQ